jgi:hypothetical protein
MIVVVEVADKELVEDAVVASSSQPTDAKSARLGRSLHPP